jgi:hypothetical protein
MGETGGKELVENSLSQIKEIKGENSYDYATIYRHYMNEG